MIFVSWDGLSANRNFFHIERDSVLKSNLPYKMTNPFDTSRIIYYFCNVIHLLKTARKCFCYSFAHSYSRTLKVSIFYFKFYCADKKFYHYWIIPPAFGICNQQRATKSGQQEVVTIFICSSIAGILCNGSYRQVSMVAL